MIKYTVVAFVIGEITIKERNSFSNHSLIF